MHHRLAGAASRILSPERTVQRQRGTKVVIYPFWCQSWPAFIGFFKFLHCQLAVCNLQGIGWELEIVLIRSSPGHRGAGAGVLQELVREAGAIRLDSWLGPARKCSDGSRVNASGRWFSVRHLPAIGLPSLDLDFRAVVSPRGGNFRRLGHRRIALVKSTGLLAGHFAMEQGISEGFTGTHSASVAPLMSSQ